MMDDNKASKNEDEQKKDHANPQPGVDRKLIDPEKTLGSGIFPDDSGEAPPVDEPANYPAADQTKIATESA